jgi:hypothetical protein
MIRYLLLWTSLMGPAFAGPGLDPPAKYDAREGTGGCAVTLSLARGLVCADELGTRVAAKTLLAEMPQSNYALVFDHPEAVRPERRPVGAVLALVAEFLSEKTGLPTAEQLPRVEFASSARIAALRYRDVSSEPELLSFSTRPNALDMFYDPVLKTIYLSELWTGGSPAELSVLVHGLVNHVQSAAGLTYPCAQSREQVAFAAQDAWLRLFGQNVKDAFGLDDATFLLSTECIP